jgi:hypothetical protein
MKQERGNQLWGAPFKSRKSEDRAARTIRPARRSRKSKVNLLLNY